MTGSLRTAAVAMLVIAAACSDNASTLTAPAGPRQPSAASSSYSSSSRGRRVTRYSNHVKYRDHGRRWAWGHSGKEDLSMQALLQRDGTLKVTATTGDVADDGDAPGTIVKLQVKVFKPTGQLVQVRNFNDVSGTTVTVSLQGVPAGFRVQVRALIREHLDERPGRGHGHGRGGRGDDGCGIDDDHDGHGHHDGWETEVVTATDTVTPAPDLTVTLPSTGTAVAGMPVNIVATVTNPSDVGTRADCVLYVNGQAVDRATGIWVDGSDVVSCAFTTTFSGIGTQQVSVGLENLSAGEFDPANNTAVMTLNVLDPSHVTYDVTVDDHYASTMSRYDYQWRKPDGTYRNYASTDSTVDHLQTINLVGTLSRAVSFPMSQLSLQWSSGGITYEDDSFTQLASSPDSLGRACTNQLIPEQGSQLWVCSTGTGLTGTTAFGFTRFAGRVSYHSSGFADAWDGTNDPGTYTWNDNYEVNAQGGQPRLLSGTVSFNLSGTDAVGSFSATPVVALAPYTQVISSSPYTCVVTYPDNLDNNALNTCTASGSNAWGVRGHAVAL